MRKKFVSLLVILGTLLNLIVPVNAAVQKEILIEAEDYVTAHKLFGVNTQSGFSGEKAIVVYSMPDSNRIIAEYKVNVPIAGNYKITAIGSENKTTWTSDWTIAVNNKDTKLSDFKVIRAITEGVNDKGLYKEYDAGIARFKKGENTIYVEADNTDRQSEGCIVCYVDCMKLTPTNTPFEFDRVEFLGNKIGVFEKGDNVAVRMYFSTIAPEPRKFNFKIEDYWKRTVLEGETTVQKGKDINDINLGAFEVGWYRIYLTEPGSDKQLARYLAFSVTHPLSKRTKYDDTTLAMDVGLEYTTNMHLQNDYIEAITLGGFDWIRNRGGTPQKDEAKKEYRKKLDENGISGMDCLDQFEGSEFRGNLLTTYDKIKKMGANGENVDEVMEIHNELDLPGGKDYGTADNYASYFKAISIALSDSETKPYKVFSGLGMFMGAWIDNMLMNDIMSYSDAYVYHSHTEYTLRAIKARAYANAYSDVAPAVWNGESGKHQPWQDNRQLTYAQLKDGARVAITSAMTSVINGTDKNFYFILRPYTENNGNFSAFHTDNRPFPIFSALANATYQLGEANLKGEATNLPAGVQGYMFDDGKGNDVFIFWADKNSNYVYLNAPSAVYSDIMGYEEVKYANEDGKLKIMVTEDPIYLKLTGRSDASNYYPINREKKNIFDSTNTTFEPHERIVIQQIWPKSIMNRKNGHQIEADTEIPVTVNVYNFNNKPVSGKLELKMDKDMAADLGDLDYNIEAFGKQTFTYNFRQSEKALGGNKGYIRFDGTTSDGKELSPSVTMYQISQTSRPPIEDKDIVVFDDFYVKEKWDLTNIGEGGKIEFTSHPETKSATFQNFWGMAAWSFPMYTIDDPSIFEGTSGFVVDQVCGEGVDGQVHQMYVYMKDGRNYYSGVIPANSYDTEKKRLVFPWSSFTLYFSPLGGVDIRQFRFEDISHISLGISTNMKAQPSYTISNFGVFYSDLETDKMDQSKNLKFDGMEENGVYKKGEALALNVDLPDDNIQKVRVMINDSEYDNFTVDGNKAVINLSGMDKGKYMLMVFAYDDMGYAYIGTLQYYIE